MTYQEFVKEYVGLDKDIIDELHKNLSCIKQLSIEHIRDIQQYPDDGFRNIYFTEIRTYYASLLEDYAEPIVRALANVKFPFCDFTKISQTLTELKTSSDVALKLYLNLRRIYLKMCGYDK